MSTKFSSFKEQYQKFNRQLSDFVRLDRTKSTARKIISSIWALVFGIAIALVFIGFNAKSNPFVLFSKLGNAFNDLYENKLITYFVIFGFSGLACAIAFKSGLFNIGISGQMMITSTIIFSLYMGLGLQKITIGYLILGFVLAILASTLIGALSGILKAYLNVHEVISTILLNWIVAKLNTFLFKYTNSPFGDDKAKIFIDGETGSGISSGAFKIVNNGGTNIFDSTQHIMGYIFLVLFIVVAIGLFVMYKWTTTGYKLKMLGISKSNGEYVGINEKASTVYVMMLSGAFAGIAGFFYYVFNNEIRNVDGAVPIAIGFEAIAISLLALNSSIGIILTSLFYAVLYTARPSLQSYPLYIREDELQIITSLILYLAALAQIFLQFKPIKFSVQSSIKLSSRVYWAIQLNYWLQRRKINLIKRYSRIKNRIEKTIKAENSEVKINKYKTAKTKYFKAIAVIDAKIEYAEQKLSIVKELQKIKANIFFDKLIINRQIRLLNQKNILFLPNHPYSVAEMVELNQKIHELKQDKNNKSQVAELKQKLTELNNSNLPKFKDVFAEKIAELNSKKLENKDVYKSKLAEYKTTVQTMKQNLKNQIISAQKTSLEFDLNQFNKDSKSFAEKIRELKKAYKAQQNKVLSVDKNLPSNEILNIFNQHAEHKKHFNNQMLLFKADAIKQIKMQYRSDLTVLKQETNKQIDENNKFIVKHYFKEFLGKKHLLKGGIIW
ncbi:ABC transporter permease subunit [Mycoplasmopsis iners]|uniref:ABC transporter permease subunit n=1 Tax=Mycoplasmopsis iners TaxID=76630 RepID=UPI0004977D1E|nr:hypothetical protein [Mycoplasmopsis iners]